ncbi:MAG: hypothetical protein QOE37_2399 [Microbacteriaceae bacterium]|nr:hypothetical protein [Microbacteriaceae bacterium]
MAISHRLHQPVWPAWLQRAWHPTDEHALEALVSALDAVDPTPVAERWDETAFVEPVIETVDQAFYWEAPSDTDQVTRDPAVVAGLTPIAAAVAGAPGTAWWDSPVDLSRLRVVRPVHGPLRTVALTGAGRRLESWRTATVQDELRADNGGRWWSGPQWPGLVTTSRPLAGVPAVELVWEEDALWLPEVLLWRVAPSREPRVYELDGPAALTALVERYPLDVSASSLDNWYRTTGRHGSWHIPDWSAVAAEWDAVHLTVGAYLSTATRALPLLEGSATMLAGWSPDRTWWLTDCLRLEENRPERWRNLDRTAGQNQPWERVE